MKPILPGAMLGLLGGGQLGRMFTMVAHQMGYQVTVLDPDTDSPAGRVADQFICADYADKDALAQLSSQCSAITTEFENIAASALSTLAEQCIVRPDAHSVTIAQNRILEKRFLQSHGLTVAPFEVIEQAGCPDTIDDIFPGILKVSQFGYDGKGQRHVDNAAGLAAAFNDLGSVPCVLEQKLPLKCEVSVVLARSYDGSIVYFPVVENQHANGILDVSIVSARVSAGVAANARDMAGKIAQALAYQGVLCVEFFVLDDDRLVVNEIAPRPHNSGHFSIDACVTSQFEQQVRALCGMPLGDTVLHQSCVMVNLLGDIWQSAEPDWYQLLSEPSVKLHLYGKTEARPGRKMGHFTVLDATTEKALERALHLKQQLELSGHAAMQSSGTGY